MAVHYDINWLIEKFENGETLQYIFFWGHSNKSKEKVGKFCFSQWFESPFTVDNTTYHTAEHWMMAQKALLFNDKNSFDKIIRSQQPAEVKKIGRQVPGYDDKIWNERKFEIVKTGNIHKFNQHPQLVDYLLATENKVLVEASPVDTIWGIGLSQDSHHIENIYAWRGQNLLGFALMEARDFLNELGVFKPLENAMAAPWTTFPFVQKEDTFWRMGKGEDYLATFNKYFNQLTAREQRIYRLIHPEPLDWEGFYD